MQEKGLSEQQQGYVKFLSSTVLGQTCSLLAVPAKAQIFPVRIHHLQPTTFDQHLMHSRRNEQRLDEATSVQPLQLCCLLKATPCRPSNVLHTRGNAQLVVFLRN